MRVLLNKQFFYCERFGQFVIVQRQKVVGKNSRARTGRDIYKIYRARLRLIFANKIYIKLLYISLEVVHRSKKENLNIKAIQGREEL